MLYNIWYYLYIHCTCRLSWVQSWMTSRMLVTFCIFFFSFRAKSKLVSLNITIKLQKTFYCHRMIQVDRFHQVYQSKNIIIWKNSSGRLFLNQTLKVHSPQSLSIIYYSNHNHFFSIIVLWRFLIVWKLFVRKWEI